MIDSDQYLHFGDSENHERQTYVNGVIASVSTYAPYERVQGGAHGGLTNAATCSFDRIDATYGPPIDAILKCVYVGGAATVAGIVGMLAPASAGTSTPITHAAEHAAAKGRGRSRWYAFAGETLSSQVCVDATEFRNAIPEDLDPTSIWSDGDEIVFEWLDGDSHAFATVEGNRLIGYAMRAGDQFIPGEDVQAPPSFVPKDLDAYLRVK